MPAKLNILVLDDDRDDIYLLCDVMSGIDGQDYSIDVSENVTQATQFLVENKYDLILCDYRLGSITGIDFIRMIRDAGWDTPTILLTGMSDKAIDNAALSAGAADYISKSDLTGPVIDRAIRYAVASAARQNLLSTVISNVSAAVCVTDNSGKPELWNSRFEELAGTLNKDGVESANVAGLAAKAMNSEKVLKIGARVLEKSATPLPDERVVITMHDVSDHIKALRERELAQKKSAHLAMHCPLTGLPNRLEFSEEVTRKIRDGDRFQILNLDLNRFKEVNDVFGHEIGDEILRKVASRLRTCCLPTDSLMRIGGDEFVALQTLGPDEKSSTRLAQNIETAICREFTLSGRSIKIGVSIGIAAFPDNGDSVETLLSSSDIAMYRAKANSHSNIQFYDQKLDKAVRERRALLVELREAVANDELMVHFQPLIDVQTSKILGFEALARWFHPERGFIPPDQFIRIAEENGLIEKLGESILRKACELATSWPCPVKVAVNVSGVQIRHTDLVTTVRDILLETGLPARRLELEITESVLLDDFDYSLHVLRGLKNLGLSLAMDDFGTGHSSLSSLISFPFDKIKIDRSFVTELDNRERLANVVKTCIGLGKNLNLRILAEGVERPSHIEFLAAEGCHEMQGFLLGKPMSNEDAILYMKKRAGNATWEAPAPRHLSRATYNAG